MTEIDRGIDHVVLCVNDLDAARRLYSALGFTLTPTARHPFGTENSLIQLDGNFIELLSVADPSIIAPPGAGQFSFAHHNKRFLEQGEGFSMLVFEGHDARADQAEFSLKQLDTYEPFDFSRKAQLPDGDEVTVGFSLAFVTHDDMPNVAFFTCQQHAPEHFWKPEYQVHDNSARLLRAAVMVAETPQDYAIFYRALQGTDAVEAVPDGLRVATSRGEILVMSRAAYRHRFGTDAPDLSAGPRFAAMAIEVGDLDAVAACAAANSIEIEQASGAVRVPASHAFGVDIEFVER